MSQQILAVLKRKLDDISKSGELTAETLNNALKEELQFYMLNFIYHNPQYSRWVMYGGSALRICHGLNRMSVDLDFEVDQPITQNFLEKFKGELEEHFRGAYAADPGFLSIKITSTRGLLLKFDVGSQLSFGYPSRETHVKVDLNYFVTPKVATERIVINRDQLSFVIVTYNMSTLMASKLAAIFLRGVRGVGEAIYEEKGRDLYDLLWYMGQKILPDFGYLAAKGVDVKNPKILFDKLTIKILNNPGTDENLKNDLLPLFENRNYIENWLKNWRETYLQLQNDYKIRTVLTLKGVEVQEELRAGNFFFIFTYYTDSRDVVKVVYVLSDYWIDLHSENLPIDVDHKIGELLVFSRNGMSSHLVFREKLEQYATLFNGKNERYFAKMNRVVVGDVITTKLIRMTAENLNPQRQILLNGSALLSCELEELLK